MFKKNIFLLFLVTITGLLWGEREGYAQVQILTPLSNNSLKLSQAIKLIEKTTFGSRFKKDIDVLLTDNKIRLIKMKRGHFGESGEGCVIKNGQYFFEGFFIDLNQSSSVQLLAISLVHELTHYQMINHLINQKLAPVTVATLEISAFAYQYQFMQELARLGLIDLIHMFEGNYAIINKIMQLSSQAIQVKSAELDRAAIEQLRLYGYPSSQLKRKLMIRQVDQCQGRVKSNTH